jgi:hypothetical protein
MPSIASRLFAVALVVFAVVLALSVAPARSAETATPDDTARFLAGLPPAQNSPLAVLAKDPGWAQHAHFFDTIFSREDASTLAKVRAFAKEHLPQHSDTMLYMFSGPDFLYATSFFPSASTYVLSGLEPVGDVPQLTSLPRGAVDGSLRNIEGSLATILNLSFFITKNMKTQLTAGPIYGTLPILYVFLARTGKTVHEVSFVSLDKDGNFIVADDAGRRAGRRPRKAPPRASRSSSPTAADRGRRCIISAPICPTAASRFPAFCNSAPSSVPPTASSKARPI